MLRLKKKKKTYTRTQIISFEHKTQFILQFCYIIDGLPVGETDQL